MKHLSFFLTLFLALQGSLNIHAATKPGSLPVLFQPSKTWVNNHASVFSDFDGDSKSDLAIGKSAGDIYEVEIRLSTLSKSASFKFGSRQAGIRLLACDVDQDNDQDLILLSSTSLCPLAIWLNDGKGHFAQGNRWLWLDLIASDNPLGVDLWHSAVEPASITTDNRLPFDNFAASFQARILDPQDLLFREPHFVFSSILSLHLAARSPPS